MRESPGAATASRVAAKETSGYPPIFPRTRAVLALILVAGLTASVTGLDWGLPYHLACSTKYTAAALGAPGRVQDVDRLRDLFIRVPLRGPGR